MKPFDNNIEKIQKKLLYDPGFTEGIVSAKLLETIPLSNGLTLTFWDESRPTAGDRWYVAVRAVVAVPLAGRVLESPLEEALHLLKKEVGDTIHYRFLEEKHFVPALEVAGQQRELLQIFSENNLKYLSHPHFSGHFIRRKASEIQAKKGWPGEHLQKILEDLRGPR
jgi:hypothetical protein